LGPVEYGPTTNGIGAKMTIKLSDDAQFQIGGRWQRDGEWGIGIRLRIRF